MEWNRLSAGKHHKHVKANETFWLHEQIGELENWRTSHHKNLCCLRKFEMPKNLSQPFQNIWEIYDFKFSLVSKIWDSQEKVKFPVVWDFPTYETQAFFPLNNSTWSWIQHKFGIHYRSPFISSKGLCFLFYFLQTWLHRSRLPSWFIIWTHLSHDSLLCLAWTVHGWKMPTHLGLV